MPGMKVPLLAAVLSLPMATHATDTLPPVSALQQQTVVDLLDHTVDWYRTLGTQQQSITEPSEQLIVYANQQTADALIANVIALARADAELLSSEGESDVDSNGTPSFEMLSAEQHQLDETLAHAQLASAHRAPAASAGELQNDIAMLRARKNLLDTMSQFVAQTTRTGAGASELKAHIDAVAATVPPVQAQTGSGASSTAAASTGGGAKTAASANTLHQGLLGLAQQTSRDRNKLALIASISQRTRGLRDTFQTISVTPLRQLQAYADSSQALGAEAASAKGSQVTALRATFDTTAWLFQQTSAIYVPLEQAIVLLNQYDRNLQSWRSSVSRQYRDDIQSFGIRIALVAGVLVVIFLLAEIWRRSVVRYIPDPRRRNQLLMIRRLVVWLVVIGVLILNLITEVSTLLTFAGLLTAGLTVAMQSLLLSIVGYFFLIGKYGIRVGDRVQVGTVVGQVAELGLVRMHLLELGGAGTASETGRVIGIANLVVFQSPNGVFRQLPTQAMDWHEVDVPLPPATDYTQLKQQLLTAVQSCAAAGRETGQETGPAVRFQLRADQLHALIRYPVRVDAAAETDERVALSVAQILAAHR